MSEDDELLERLGKAVDPPVPPVDPERLAAVRALAARAEAQAAPTRPSRRSLLRVGAAAAGGIAAGVAGVVLLTDDEPAGPPLERVALRTAGGVDATAELIDHTWGMEVLLDVSGLEPGVDYAMTFVANDGRTTGAGGFIGTGSLMRCRNNGPLLRADAAGITVTGPDGEEVVAADLT